MGKQNYQIKIQNAEKAKFEIIARGMRLILRTAGLTFSIRCTSDEESEGQILHQKRKMNSRDS